MATPRRFFRPKTTPETGRHDAYRQKLEGEYAFDPDTGNLSPFETYNAATQELQAILRDCKEKGKSLRARGSLWSLSKVAVTDGYLIDTKALRLAFEVPKALTNPSYPGDSHLLRFVECGNSVAALNDYLFSAGLSIKGCGSNNGQTVAGAISTGTHGGGYRFGAMQDMVVGLHLITGADKHVYLERNAMPVMQPAFAQSIGADLIRDDTLFNAALVSFGSFGIIHGMMIETRALFALNAVRFRFPYRESLKSAITTCDPQQIPLPATAQAMPQSQPYHFEVFFNPNEGTPPEDAIVLLMFEAPYDANSYIPPSWHGGESGLSASGLNVMGALVGKIPDPLNQLAVPFLNEQVKEEFSPYFKHGIIRDLFRGEKTLGKTLACGVGMPVPRAIEAIDIAFNVYQDAKVILPVILSFRFVKGTQALLGFTRFEPTAVLEMDAVNTPQTRAYFSQVLHALNKAGIPFTLHWGKYNDFLTAERLRACYGETAIDQWVSSRETLLDDPAVRQMFTNTFIARLGLAT
jgi:hypothetical protein